MDKKIRRRAVVANSGVGGFSLPCLSKSHLRFGGIFELGCDAILVFRAADKRIVFVNKTFVRLARVSKRKAIGSTLEELGLWSKRAQRRLEALKPYGRSFKAELHPKNGVVLSLSISAAPITIDGQAHIMGCLCDRDDRAYSRHKKEDSRGELSAQVLKLKKAQARLRGEIGERKLIEQELRRSESFVRTIIETSPDSISVNRVRDRTFTAINDSFVREFGFSREEVRGKSAEELQIWAEPVRAHEFNDRLLKNCVVHAEEIAIRRKDGNVIPALVSAVLTDFGSEQSIVTTVRTISQLKDTEARLREREETLRRVLDTTTDIIAMVRLSDQIIVEANHAIEHLGYKRENLIGVPWTRYVWTSQDNRDLREFFRRLEDDRILTNVEVEFIRKDGAYLSVLLSGGIVEIGADKYAVVNTRDVSQLKNTERLLRESEASLRKIFEGNSDPMTIIDQATGRIVDVNREFLRFYGFSAKEQILGRLRKEVVPQKGAQLRELKERLARDGEVRNMLCEFKNRDDVSVPMLFSAMTMELAGRMCLVTSARDISMLKEAERKLAHNELILRTLVESSSDTISINRASDGTFISVNDAFERLFGYSRQETIGRSAADLIIFPDRSQLRAAAQQLKTDRVVPRSEFVCRRKDGKEIVVQFSAALAEIAGEECVISIHRDISDLKTIETELIAAREAALGASQAKSEFLSSMSHEIRTPMNAIFGMAELLSQGSLSSEQARYVEIMKSNCDALLDLINDVLDLAKIESGRLKLDSVNFDLEHLTGGLGEMMALRAHEKGLELAIRIADDVPANLLGDPLRLRQILVNLLGNAIKFTKSGQIVLEVERANPKHNHGVPAHTAEGAFELRFTVHDTGIGIAPDKIDRIFCSFEQADSSTTRLYGGSGLGLAIVKRLVDLYSGALSVESEVGKGSSFSFTAKFAIGDTVTAPGSSPPSVLKGIKVLVVDDTPVNRLILRESFEHVGAQVHEAESGDQALALIERACLTNHPFQLLVIDCRMPDMDGFELIKRTRRLFAVSGDHPPALLMVTSDDQPRRIASLQELGTDHYLVKPVRRPELLRAAIRLISNPSGNHLLQFQPKSDRPIAPLPNMRVLIVDDSATNRLLLREYLEGQPLQVDEAENGRAAREKFEAGNYDLVLMDMRMPIEDGYAATRSIRAWETANARARTPVIALTASALRDDVVRCLEAGCDTHLSKPIKRQTLLQAIHEFAYSPKMSSAM